MNCVNAVLLVSLYIVTGVEPMIMGSPHSPHSGSHNTSQYLPGFLLGENTPGPSAMHSVRFFVAMHHLYYR